MAFYKNELFTKHPNSIYSKLIRNPNYYRDSKIANKFAESEYKDVYNLYKNNQYSEADSIASSIILKYPDSGILDKLAYMKILCTIKNPNTAVALDVIQSDIKAFTELYPESKLVPLATKLSEALDKRASTDAKEVEDLKLKESDTSQPLPDSTIEENPNPPIDNSNTIEAK